MQIERDRIKLVPMTAEMYRSFLREYENDPDLYLPGQEYVPYEYSEQKVAKYIQRQQDLQHTCATLSIALKNAQYKDCGIGTQAEQLAIQYVFDELDIPTLYADTIQTNGRSQYVLEKAGFTLIREEQDFKYYRIDRK